MQWKSTKGATIEPGVLYAVIKDPGFDGFYPEWEIVESFDDSQILWSPQYLNMGCTIEYYDIYCELPRVD